MESMGIWGLSPRIIPMDDKQKRIERTYVRLTLDEKKAFETKLVADGATFQDMLYSCVMAYVSGAAPVVPKTEQPAQVPVPTRSTPPEATAHDAGGATVDDKLNQLATLIGEVVGELRKLGDEVRGDKGRTQGNRASAGKRKAG
jgi:hypothetical protein